MLTLALLCSKRGALGDARPIRTCYKVQYVVNIIRYHSKLLLIILLPVFRSQIIDVKRFDLDILHFCVIFFNYTSSVSRHLMRILVGVEETNPGNEIIEVGSLQVHARSRFVVVGCCSI